MAIDINAIQMDPSWKEVLKEEFQKEYFVKIQEFLEQEKNAGKIIFPQDSNIFAAFNHTPFSQTQVVILWQDPYHGEGEAHGLCFSVQEGVKIPPSLRNMYKELHSDLGVPIPKTWDLTKRAKQWVFLLNSTLTVRKDEPNSHKDAGRQEFTDAVIKKLSDQKSGLIFLLWGAYAQTKEMLIDASKHIVLKSPHPSPFSANKGFFGCKHFSKVNEILQKQWKAIIER